MISGLSEFEQSVRYLNKKDYDQAEKYLKEALTVIKKANKEQSLGYLFLLKRLAHCSYLNRRYGEAEKYFKVCTQLSGNVTKNPANIFNSQKNLLLLYTYTNIDKALEYGDTL